MLVPVYDIVDCGPRHRYWANGKLIHNCDSINWQNLPRGSRLREAIIPPKGYKLVVCDLAGIEARMLSYLAGQEDALNIFRAGEDIYCDMATSIYGRKITKEQKKERFVGKQVILAAGYQMGWKKFQSNAYLVNKTVFDESFVQDLCIDVQSFVGKNHKYIIQAKPATMTEEQFINHCAVSKYLVEAYRSKNWRIVDFWAECHRAIGAACDGLQTTFTSPGILWTTRGQINAPVGAPLRYSNLERVQDGKRTGYTKKSRTGTLHISPGTATENIVQWLSRHLLAYQLLQLHSEGLRTVFTCHDEIVAIAPDSEAEAWLARMEEVMRATPEWAPGLPLDCEGSVAENYKEAK